MEGFREYDLIRWRIFGDVLLKKFQNTDGVNGTNKNVPWPSLQVLGTFNGLKIEIPKTLPSKYALVFKIGLDETSSQMWEMIIE